MMHPPARTLRDLLALAFIDGMDRKAAEAAARRRAALMPLDDTGRAPVVRLRGVGG